MIHLAYDGSLNGDWVSRYAIRLAARDPAASLAVVHVEDASVSPEVLAAKLDRIEREARDWGVAVERQLVSSARDVFAALRQRLPRGPDEVIVCGTRVRSRRGFLAGTISQRLLREPGLHVVALRVVQPGLLGNPRSILVPVSGNLQGVASAWPFFRLFLAGAERVSLLRIMRLGTLHLPYASPARKRKLREIGWRQLQELADEMKRRLEPAPSHLDARVVISDDWPHEILVNAGQLRARLILMGASERTLLSRSLGDPLERILRGTPCDVALCRSR